VLVTPLHYDSPIEIAGSCSKRNKKSFGVAFGLLPPAGRDSLADTS
jgi:hypothetical protein